MKPPVDDPIIANVVLDLGCNHDEEKPTHNNSEQNRKNDEWVSWHATVHILQFLLCLSFHGQAVVQRQVGKVDRAVEAEDDHLAELEIRKT